MRTGVAAVLVAGAAVLSPQGAQAVDPTLAGTTCGMAATNDILGLFENPGTLIGPMYAAVGAATVATVGGTVDVDPTANPIAVTVRCAVVGGVGSYFDHVATWTRGEGTGAAVAAEVVWFSATPNEAVYVCTTITVVDARGRTSTKYYDAPSGQLVSDAATATCALAIWQVLPPPTVCDLAAELCPLDPQWNIVVVPRQLT